MYDDDTNWILVIVTIAFIIVVVTLIIFGIVTTKNYVGQYCAPDQKTCVYEIRPNQCDDYYDVGGFDQSIQYKLVSGSCREQ